MDLLQMLKENKFKKTGESKKFKIPGQHHNIYDVSACRQSPPFEVDFVVF